MGPKRIVLLSFRSINDVLKQYPMMGAENEINKK